MRMDLKDDRGIALILAISIIGLIVLLNMEFSRSIQTGLYETANFDDGIRLGVIARSGINCGLAVLFEDDSNEDSFRDTWASLKEYSSYSASLFENDSRFETEIIDLAGKIQVNRLINQDGKYNIKQKEIMARLLSASDFLLEPDEVEDILDAIKDWIDTDNEPTRFGPEESYYQALDRPYSCRNAPLESLEEMLLIKGITPELFYGGEDTPGISDYFTVHGDGDININTADPLILASLSEDLDSGMIEEMVTFREDEKNDLNNPEWYKSALGTNETIIDPSLITIKSEYFEIRSRGINVSRSREIRAAVKRKGKSLTVLSWKTL
jgi:general secretion pathway protein K